ncbi:cyclin-B1-5-like [Magnolia sinica]|uniref:cyclin-B1-5-like n=1 Tax=Magnolia sinica TaxID=86752 RepID=UPI00265B4AF0|nr:cyclin-B1-5-like [Magnolia sinica]
MGKKMLNKLKWSITVPTPYVFLVRFLKAALSDKEMEHMVFFFAELALTQYCMIKRCSSMIVALWCMRPNAPYRRVPSGTRRSSDTLGLPRQSSLLALFPCVESFVN